MTLMGNGKAGAYPNFLATPKPMRVGPYQSLSLAIFDAYAVYIYMLYIKVEATEINIHMSAA
jgi:hypothetical protein